ncbi:hypothetical protein SRHO_G00139580 [Serrasalmus rhombeus]
MELVKADGKLTSSPSPAVHHGGGWVDRAGHDGALLYSLSRQGRDVEGSGPMGGECPVASEDLDYSFRVSKPH